ncbi:hypothetical protein ACSPAH_10320 [Buttiauxella agrestis]
MKRIISAASLLLILASANVMAEQSGNFSTTQTNHGSMIIPRLKAARRTATRLAISQNSWVHRTTRKMLTDSLFGGPSFLPASFPV